MESFYNKFLAYLSEENKYESVNYILTKLSIGAIDIVSLYEKILKPAMQADYCAASDQDLCIWREHIRTSIVRTIIECCFPYVIQERDKKYHSPERGRALIVCPTEEYHEIGARMVADYFTLCGFDAVFVGANTPQEEIVKAIEHIKPKYVALSVTTHFNLVAADRCVKTLAEIRNRSGLNFIIITGGDAFIKNPDMSHKMGADLLLDTFEEISRLK